MGIPFFVVFVLSIAFLSLGITGWGDFVSVEWDKQNSSEATSDTAAVTPYLSFQSDYWAIARCFIGFFAVFGEPLFYGILPLSRRTRKWQDYEER